MAAAFMVLEEYEQNAKKRGAKIYANSPGFGIVAEDALPRLTSHQKGGQRAALCMKRFKSAKTSTS